MAREKYVIHVLEETGNETLLLYKDRESAVNDMKRFSYSEKSPLKYVALRNIINSMVVRLIIFVGGEPQCVLRDREIVRIRDGMCGKDLEGRLFVVSDIDENDGECLIVCIDDDLLVHNSMVVNVEILEPVEVTAKC